MEASQPRNHSHRRQGRRALHDSKSASKHAAEAKGCSDALFMDWEGYAAEATGANIFFIKDGEVHTPPQTAS